MNFGQTLGALLYCQLTNYQLQLVKYSSIIFGITFLKLENEKINDNDDFLFLKGIYPMQVKILFVLPYC